MTMTVVDLDAAQVTRDGDGLVTIDDPGCPLLVSVRVERYGTRRADPHRITELTVRTRHPSGRIAAGTLARLPLSQIRQLAAAAHTNEHYYRALAVPKQPGRRGWDDGHWQRVLEVYEWARSTGRPGGPARAIADLWAVAVDPTVYRWLATARCRARQGLISADARRSERPPAGDMSTTVDGYCVTPCPSPSAHSRS